MWPELLANYGRFVTTNLVVSETYTFSRNEIGFATAWDFLERTGQTPRLDIVMSDPVLEAQARRLLVKYHDHDFSYADAVSFAVLRQLGIKDAFAFDRHFEVAGFTKIP